MTNSVVYDGCLKTNVHLATRNCINCLEALHIFALMDEKLHFLFPNIRFFHDLTSSLINLETSNS